MSNACSQHGLAITGARQQASRPAQCVEARKKQEEQQEPEEESEELEELEEQEEQEHEQKEARRSVQGVLLVDHGSNRDASNKMLEEFVKVYK